MVSPKKLVLYKNTKAMVHSSDSDIDHMLIVSVLCFLGEIYEE